MNNITIDQIYKLIAGGVGVITTLTVAVKYIKNVVSKINEPLEEVKNSIKEIKNEVEIINNDGEKMREAILCTIRQSLLKSCEDYIMRGFATSSQKDSITRAYKIYKELGGDSYITNLVNQVMELPLNKPRARKVTKNENN